jgi:single-strand DNA-binding protein
LADNLAESLKTGARVLVTGRLQSRTWETEDGQKRSAVEIEAAEVAASLRFATVTITKTAKAEEPSAEQAPAEYDRRTGEPFGTQVLGGSLFACAPRPRFFLYPEKMRTGRDT